MNIKLKYPHCYRPGRNGDVWFWAHHRSPLVHERSWVPHLNQEVVDWLLANGVAKESIRQNYDTEAPIDEVPAPCPDHYHEFAIRVHMTLDTFTRFKLTWL